MSQILAYRLTKRKWKATAFDGEGAMTYGGRWNSKGKSCVYLSGSESLAILEVMVHLDDNSLLQHYIMYKITLTEKNILSLASDKLPVEWRDEPAPPETADIGDMWLEGMTSLALAVPSVIVPNEYNYILNPAHPDFKSTVQTAEEVNFQPDDRL